MKPCDPRPVVADLLRPLRRGQGVRVGCLGQTESGKSYALREILRGVVPRVDVAIAIDDKEGARNFQGQERIDLEDIRARPLTPLSEGGSRLVVLTGDVWANRRPAPEDVATHAWWLAAPPRRLRVAVVVDELSRAAYMRFRTAVWARANGNMPRIFTEGRAPGLSCLWGTQHPQKVPLEAFSESHLLLFRMDGREAEYLYRLRLIDRAALEGLPRLQVGQFFLRALGRNHDGATVYRF